MVTTTIVAQVYKQRKHSCNGAEQSSTIGTAIS